MFGLSKKARDLWILLAIYVFAYFVGYLACRRLSEPVVQFFVFDSVATVVVFAFSALLHNASVYDPYWSVAPMVMIVWLFGKSYNVMRVVFLLVFLAWAVRLTGNWMAVFTDFSYEDWRYRKFRSQTPRLFWPIVNFFGIHYMPTLVVFAGMLPLFSISVKPIGIWSLGGILVMVAAVGLEYFADRQMHAFLASGGRGICEVGLWKYSRHPNYLGEILFWCGVYLAMLPYDLSHWYYGVGCLSVCVLFNIVSIPLMEKRQLSRRAAYKDYQQSTSRLLLRLPKRR